MELSPKDLQVPTEFLCMVGKKTASVRPGAPRSSSGNYCAECKCENAWQRRFCRMCGSGLTKSCTACQFNNGVLDRFCGGCGGETEVRAQTPARNPSQVVAKMARPEVPRIVEAPSPQPIQSSAASTSALASRLASLNADKVQARLVTPPPPPGVKAKKDEIGQEQIDALFG